MAVVETLTFAFLICQVNSQTFSFSPINFIQPGCEPTAPSCTDICRPPVPVGTIQTVPNLVFLSQPNSNNVPCNQPCSNSPAPPCIQNQVLINQPFKNTALPAQPNMKNILPKCTNVKVAPMCQNKPQLTPSVITNPAPNTPVVTVVDNTLANSLANALQLLIISNLLEDSTACNLPQNLPCTNNYEIVAPDFIAPSMSFDYISNRVSVPESVCCCPEPVFSCTGPVVSCPEPVCSCQEPMICCPEPMICQSYSTNYGGSLPFIDDSGFQCGPNQIFLETPTQYVTQVAPICSEPVAQIPAMATIPQMALELPFPESIPAQLTCNFGFLPSNEPCVTFNVEPLPCKNMLGNFVNLAQY